MLCREKARVNRNRGRIPASCKGTKSKGTPCISDEDVPITARRSYNGRFSYHAAFKRKEAFTSNINAGTSTRGPMTAANASPDASPTVAAATAMVSSKLFPVAVKATDAMLG